jgi:hypothetical protein
MFFAKKQGCIMKMRGVVGVVVGVVVLQGSFVEARCSGFDPGCWFKEAGKGIETAAEETGKAFEKAGKEVAKTAEQVGHEIEKAGGVIAQVGVKVGDVTIKEISKTGDIIVDVAGKAGREILKTGQAVVTSTGMTLVNVGGVVVALTTGDIKNIKACANAVSSSSRYGLAMVVDESLKAVGNIDKLVQIDSFSLEASAAELALQGKTPKVSIKGSFLGKNFTIKDVQLDLSNPDKCIADLLELLVKLQ